MEVNVVLNDRLYNDINALAYEMKISVPDCLARMIEDKFYTDKYGDLNEAFNRPNKASNAEDKKDEILNKVDKDNIRQEKSTAVGKDAVVEKNKDETVVDKTTEKIKKRVTRTRTIKSK